MTLRAASLVSVLIVSFCLGVVFAVPLDGDDPDKGRSCPADEVYYKCSLEQCYTECTHLKNPPPCPAIAPGCNKPACLCKGDWLRNRDGKCVPFEQCS